MDIDNVIVTIELIIFIGIGALFIIIWRRKNKLESLNYTIAQQWINLSEEMKEVVNKTPIDRALVLVAQNGNEIKYGSVVLEHNTGDVVTVKDKFSKMELDPTYTSMIEQLTRTGSMVLSTESLPEGRYLRTRYEADNIKHGFIYFIGEKENKGFGHKLLKSLHPRYLYRRIYYISFTTLSDDVFDAKTLANLTSHANNIKNIVLKIIKSSNQF